jgi:RNA-directed DNA polymerase
MAAKPDIRRATVRRGDGVGMKFRAPYPGRPPGLRRGASSASGTRQEREDEATKGREESDHRTVPKGRGNPVPTRHVPRGGKAVTGSEQARQRRLPFGTADSPQGADAGAETSQPVAATVAVPKPKVTRRSAPPTMTMEEVASGANLMEAFRCVASNDGAPGPDRQSVAEVREHLKTILPCLGRELLDGSYRPGNIRRVWIPKAGGGQRGLGIPDVVDRIVQQAVLQVLSPHYDPTFHASSHGFRPGRSCHTAIVEARQHLEEGYDWVVDFDLAQFFDRVHHDRLLARLEQRIKDRRLLQLIRQMLKAKVVMPDGVVVSTEEGTPQGGPLSPLLSNIVLDELDWELARRGYRFVRYADDANVYVRSQRAGHRVMASLVRFIERRLRLKVNAAKSAVARPEERHFLGFRLRRDPRDGNVDVFLSERSSKRIAETIRSLIPRTWGNSLEACIERLNEYLRGWIGFFWICTRVQSMLTHLDAHIRRRLRALLLRHWRRRRSIVRRLVRLGVKPEQARREVYGNKRLWWKLSHSPAVDRALPTKYFAQCGLVSLLAVWKAHHVPACVIVPVQLGLDFG